MKLSTSLRMRLTIVILVPLMLIAIFVGSWAYFDAQSNAVDRFDRSLLSTALAISRDIAVTGGDALSEETRDLLRDTSGGAVFYHVYAPDGVFVTGYATPPVPPRNALTEETQVFYDAVYQGDVVRALRLQQSTSVDGLTGLFSFTVWQKTSVRNGFLRSRTGPVFLVIASLLGALAVIVWFGVDRGLAPLLDLEDAIARRSASDLTRIKRRIPQEVTGIVSRFNELMAELTRTLDAKDAFISDAAHQLRNPIAGVLTLAESVSNAKSLEAAKARSADLLVAARETGHLANNLLTLERAKAMAAQETGQAFDVSKYLADITSKTTNAAKNNSVEIELNSPLKSVFACGDPVMFEQAILNLIDNALNHGGTELSTIVISLNETNEWVCVKVSDDGMGIAEADFDRAMARFGQVGPSAGSGLGLPIASAFANAFDGDLTLTHDHNFFSVTLRLRAAKTRPYGKRSAIDPTSTF